MFLDCKHSYSQLKSIKDLPSAQLFVQPLFRLVRCLCFFREYIYVKHAVSFLSTGQAVSFLSTGQVWKVTRCIEVARWSSERAPSSPCLMEPKCYL